MIEINDGSNLREAHYYQTIRKIDRLTASLSEYSPTVKYFGAETAASANAKSDPKGTNPYFADQELLFENLE